MQKHCPVVLFHHLKFNAPPLCVLLFVCSIQAYKKRHNSSKCSGLCRIIYFVYMCFSPLLFVSLAGPLVVLLALQIAALVKVSDFITALIREVAFNIESLITSRLSANYITCTLCWEAGGRPAEGCIWAPEPWPSLKPPRLSHIQGRVYYTITMLALQLKNDSGAVW